MPAEPSTSTADQSALESAALAAVADLVDGFGPVGRRLWVVLARLAEGPSTLEDLIQHAGLSRRTVEAVLEAARPDLDVRDGSYRLRADRRDLYQERFRPLPSPLAHPAEASHAAIEQLAALTRQRPAGRSDLDHVAATPATLARRAAWLARTYDLRRSRLVFLGDHDLTSLATALLHPGLDAQVVDVDEDLLAFLDAQARRLGLRLRCCYGDLRFGLPKDLTGWADVVFTDPPYSPEGVALFARQALAALRDREFGQVLVAYGFGERHAMLGWKVQQELARLGLVFEAILPGFNTYNGAQAIGSTSDLYVCRPTSRSWKPPSPSDRIGIYTRGRQATGSVAAELPVTLRHEAMQRAGSAGERVGVVADRWPGMGGAPHLRLATLLEGGTPRAWARQVRAHEETTWAAEGRKTSNDKAGAGSAAQVVSERLLGAAVVDLSEDPGPWLLRCLLSINLPRVVVVLGNAHPDLSNGARRSLQQLVKDKYQLSEPIRPDSSYPFQLLELDERVNDASAPCQLRRYVLHRAHGNIAHVWRDGLVRVRDLTKKQASAVVDGSIHAQWPSRLIDLPRHQLPILLDALDRSVGAASR